jgi:hypothetical protein
MSRTSGSLTFAIALFVAHAAAFAQEPVGYSYPYQYAHAATAGQASAMGMADLVNAAGSYNLQTSQAAINVEQARSQQLANHMQGVQNYYQMRGMYENYNKQNTTPGLTSEDAWRYAQENNPKRLKSNQLDPVTGQIYWPTLLQDPRYDALRKEIDQLFVVRERSHGAAGYEVYMQTQQATDNLLAALRKNLKEYPSGDYMMMKNFIDALAYEAKFPAV